MDFLIRRKKGAVTLKLINVTARISWFYYMSISLKCSFVQAQTRF